MFIDDYGNEFKTKNEAKEYAKKRFLKIFTEEPSFYLEDNVSKIKLIDWNFAHEETKTLFLKDYEFLRKAWIC